MARRLKGRKIVGILLLDKPKGISSNAALQRVKRLFFAQKAGHTGSLDPLASGLLPLCFGEATKISGFLLDADKRYWLRCKLGVRTATGDAEGDVIAQRPVPDFSEAQLLEVLAQFQGEISQIPPMYSALKQNGERLYKLARQGIEVDRPARQVRIYENTLLAREQDEIVLQVRCSKGTYIRTLVEDIGEILGCGAFVSELRRTGVGQYDEQNMITMDELESLATEGYAALDARLLPIESALTHWPGVQLSEDAAFYLRKGQAVIVPHAPTYGWVRLYTQDQERFLGLGQILDDGRVAPKRLVNVA